MKHEDGVDVHIRLVDRNENLQEYRNSHFSSRSRSGSHLISASPGQLCQLVVKIHPNFRMFSATVLYISIACESIRSHDEVDLDLAQCWAIELSTERTITEQYCFDGFSRWDDSNRKTITPFRIPRTCDLQTTQNADNDWTEEISAAHPGCYVVNIFRGSLVKPSRLEVRTRASKTAPLTFPDIGMGLATIINHRWFASLRSHNGFLMDCEFRNIDAADRDFTFDAVSEGPHLGKCQHTARENAGCNRGVDRSADADEQLTDEQSTDDEDLSTDDEDLTSDDEEASDDEDSSDDEEEDSSYDEEADFDSDPVDYTSRNRKMRRTRRHATHRRKEHHRRRRTSSRGASRAPMLVKETTTSSQNPGFDPVKRFGRKGTTTSDLYQPSNRKHSRCDNDDDEESTPATTTPHIKVEGDARNPITLDNHDTKIPMTEITMASPRGLASARVSRTARAGPQARADAELATRGTSEQIKAKKKARLQHELEEIDLKERKLAVLRQLRELEDGD